MTKKDFFSSLLTGFTTGAIAWGIFNFLGTRQSFGVPLLVLPVLVPILWVLGVQLGYFLSRWISPFKQFGRFAAIGFTNAAVDFGFLYLLIGTFGFNTGTWFSVFKAVSFSLATVHSYLWNKYWSFEAAESHGGRKEFFLFVTVALFSLLINVGISSVVVNTIDPSFGLDDNAWAGVGAAAGSAAALIFSFIGFRFLVFKK